jgi:hypothetical protein
VHFPFTVYLQTPYIHRKKILNFVFFVRKIPMDDPNNIPKEKLEEILEYQRRLRHPRDIPQRPSVNESINNARTTLFINLLIEILSGVVLLVGIGYTVRFLLNRRAYLDPDRLRLYLEVLAFFAAGWLTYFGFKVRARYRALRRITRLPESNGES